MARKNVIEVILQAYDRASPVFEDVAKSNEELIQKYEKSAAAFQRVGMALTAAGGAAAAAITVAVKASAEFDTAMRNVNTMARLSEDQFQALSREVVELSARVPESAASLAAGLYNVVSAGVPATEQMQFLETAAKAAAAGMTTTETAVLGVSAVIKAYGDDFNQAKRYSDLFFKTVEMGQLTFDQLATSIQKVAPAAAQLKMSQEELFAGYATLTGVTGGAAEVSTQLAAVLRSLINPSEQAKKTAEELGIQWDANLVKTKGLVGVLDELRSVEGLTEEEIGKLTGSAEANLAIMALLGPQYDVFRHKLGEMGDSAGAMTAAFEEQAKGFEFQWQTMMNQLQALKIEVGDEFIPIVAEAVGKVMEFVSALREAHPELATSAAKVMAVTAALGLTLGPLALILGFLPNVIAGIRTLGAGYVWLRTQLMAATAAQWSLNAAMAANPIGVLVLAFAAIAGPLLIYRMRTAEAAEETERMSKSIEKEIQASETKLNALERMGQRYVELVGKIREGNLAVEEEHRAKLELAEVEEQLVSVIGKEGLERIRNAENTEEAFNIEVEALNVKVEEQRKALREAIEVERHQTLQKINETEKRIKAIETEAQAYSLFGRLQARQIKNQIGYLEALYKTHTWLADKLPGKMGEAMRRATEQLPRAIEDSQAALDKLYKAEGEKEFAKLSDALKGLREEYIAQSDQIDVLTPKKQESAETDDRIADAAQRVAKAATEKNERLRQELALLDHKAKMGQLTAAQQLEELERIGRFARTQEERWAIEERIFDLRKKAQEELKKEVEAFNAGPLSDLEFKLQKLDKEWEIYKAQNADAAGTTAYLARELEYLRERSALVEQQQGALNEKHEFAAKVLGENAEETRKLALAVDDLKLRQIQADREMVEARRRAAAEIDRLHQVLVDSLRRRHEEERDLDLAAKEDAIKNARERADGVIKELEREHRMRIRLVDEQAAAEMDVLQSQIDAIDRQIAEKDRARRDAEEQARIQELQDKLTVLEREYQVKMDLAESDEERHRLAVEYAYERQKAEEAIVNAIADAEERKWREALNDQKASLREQIDGVRQRSQEEKDYLQEEYEKKREVEQAKLNETLTRLNAEREELRIHWEERLQNTQLNAEAEKLILDGKYKEIVQLLHTHAKDWNVLGKTFGQQLTEGISPSIQQLYSWLASVAAMVREVAGAVATTGPPEVLSAAGGQAVVRVPAMAEGAVVDRPTLALIGEKGREWVIPESQAQEALSTYSRFDLNVILSARGGRAGYQRGNFSKEELEEIAEYIRRWLRDKLREIGFVIN